MIYYVYEDEQRNPLFRVCRTPDKKFWQERWEDGQWVPGINGVRRVLYHLPDIIENPDTLLFITEGEKDADALRSHGILATTNPCGAGKWDDSFTFSLIGRQEVAIIPDNDQIGLEHAAQVALSLHAFSIAPKIISLPKLGAKGDVSDWLEQGGNADSLSFIVSYTEASSEEELRRSLPIPTARHDRPKCHPKPGGALSQKLLEFDILQVVGEYTQLEKRHDGWWGKCPLHDEASASFKVFPDLQGFYCFGCRKSGSAIDFVMLKRGVSFEDLLAEAKSAARHNPELIQLHRDLAQAWARYFREEEAIFREPPTTTEQSVRQATESLEDIITKAVALDRPWVRLSNKELGELWSKIPPMARAAMDLNPAEQLQLMKGRRRATIVRCFQLEHLEKGTQVW